MFKSKEAELTNYYNLKKKKHYDLVLLKHQANLFYDLSNEIYLSNAPSLNVYIIILV